MHIRLYRSILFPLLLLFAGLPLTAQTAPAPTPYKVASPSDWLTNVPPGTSFVWGDGTSFSAPQTTTATLFPASGFEVSAGPFGIVAGLQGAGNLYVLETATAITFTDAVFPAMTPTTVTVPPLAPPLPPSTGMLGLLQSSAPGVANVAQITCALTQAVLPAGTPLPLYGTPLFCVVAIIQVNTAPIVPPAASN